MSSGVFVIKKDGSLVEMQKSEYDSEEVLQKLLAGTSIKVQVN